MADWDGLAHAHKYIQAGALMMQHRLVSVAFVTLLLASKLSAQTTVYSTFGPGDSYGVGQYAVASPDAFGFGIWRAAGFLYSGPSGGLLSSIRFAARSSNSGPLDIAFLRGPSISTALILESWSLPSSTFATQIYSLSSSLQPGLSPGQIYWLMLKPGAATETFWGWSANDQGLSGIQSSYDGGATWTSELDNAPAFDVAAIQDSVVPEPATITLLGLGLLGLAAASRWRRKNALN